MLLVLYEYCNNEIFLSRKAVFVLFFLFLISCAHHLNSYFIFLKGDWDEVANKGIFLLGWRWGMGEGDGGRGMEKRERRGNLGLGT